MSFIKEFKEFAMKGNVVDMAVGIIIGVAFGKIVSSFVGDVIMPPLGLLIGGVDFSDLAITLKAASEGVAAVTLELRQIHPDRVRLHHRGAGHLHRRQSHEQTEEGRRGRTARRSRAQKRNY